MKLLHSGKVRDVYLDGEDIILVASDRVSVYDVVLPTLIPEKGKILTQLSLWWFEQLADLVPNHIMSGTDVPAEWAGRAVRCRHLDMIKVECIARGYLAGLGLREYHASGAVSGVQLPEGLVEGSRLPEPIFTPTTKSAPGEGLHDEFITFNDIVTDIGSDIACELRSITIDVYRRGAAIAAEQGIIIADTKLEFGLFNGSLMLGDELLTSDSSRFWPADDWKPGRPQYAYDKQLVRDWAAGTGWNKKSPAPEIPADIVEATQERYIDAYKKITGKHWP